MGSKKPNDLGWFDLHGNVYSWCQERYQNYPTGKTNGASEDKEDVLDIDSTSGQVLRGGSFANQASLVRSAYRAIYVPTVRGENVGFRLARTFR
jgi:eukaryotic-like serine/threonine-protein kinase